MKRTKARMAVSPTCFLDGLWDSNWLLDLNQPLFLNRCVADPF